MRSGFVGRSSLLLTLALQLFALAAALPAAAADAVKIGLIVPMTGGQASTGKQLANAVQLYIKQHGDTVGDRKIEVLLRDDAASPEATKRIAHELIVNDKVNIVAGFGITPTALAVAPWPPRQKHRKS